FSESPPGYHARKYDWNYRANSLGPGRCWLLLAGNTVVGTAGLSRRRFRLNGGPIDVGLASDFAVDREHRCFQPALMLQKAVLSSLTHDTNLIYGLPNQSAIGVFRRLGYQSLGVSSPTGLFVAVLWRLESLGWTGGG